MSDTVRIFISHSQKDDAFGQKLAGDLRKALGSEDAVWYDTSGGLHGGDAWWRKIVAELSARPIFLVILSPDAMNSKWVRDEIDLAWQQENSTAGKIIIPVLYQQCIVRPDLLTRQIISFLSPAPYDQAFQQLLIALSLASAPGFSPAAREHVAHGAGTASATTDIPADDLAWDATNHADYKRTRPDMAYTVERYRRTIVYRDHRIDIQAFGKRTGKQEVFYDGKEVASGRKYIGSGNSTFSFTVTEDGQAVSYQVGVEFVVFPAKIRVSLWRNGRVIFSEA